MKTKTCKSCKQKFQPVRPLQSCCGVPCAIAHANKLKEKSKRLEALKERRQYKDTKERLKTRSDWLKEAQIAFNSYIRKRDEGLVCISCQKPMLKKINAGHFRSVGSSPHLRFNESNCHAQCEHCNTYLSGNIGNYRINLVNKIGLEAVEALENDNTPKHYSIDDIKTIKQYYKDKLKEM